MKNFILTAMATLAMATASFAAEINYVVVGDSGRHYAVLAGPIEAGDAALLEALLSENPQITHIGLVSTGGIADEGYLLSSVISDHDKVFHNFSYLDLDLKLPMTVINTIVANHVQKVNIMPVPNNVLIAQMTIQGINARTPATSARPAILSLIHI